MPGSSIDTDAAIKYQRTCKLPLPGTEGWDMNRQVARTDSSAMLSRARGERQGCAKTDTQTVRQPGKGLRTVYVILT